MAFDKTPTTTIPSYSSDGTNMTIPIASITGLTTAEAHTTTGDIRAIILRLMTHFNTTFAALSAPDQPTKLVVNKRTEFVNSQIRRIFDVDAIVSGDLTVVAE